MLWRTLKVNRTNVGNLMVFATLIILYYGRRVSEARSGGGSGAKPQFRV